MDRGTWRAIVHGVTRVRHDLVTKPSPPPPYPYQEYCLCACLLSRCSCSQLCNTMDYSPAGFQYSSQDPASFKRLQVSLFIKNPNKPLLQPLTPIIFQLTISLWASFSLQPTFDSIIPLTQLSEAADPHYSSASSCSPPCNTGNWGPLLPSWNPHFPWLVYILPFWLCTCLADALSQVN